MQKTNVIYSDVVDCFKSFGCVLLESEYINSHTPMRYQCKCGNIYFKKYYAFKKHPYCNNCGRTAAPTQQFIEDYFQQHNCTLLEKYKNNIALMKFKCKCGNMDSKSFKTFKRNPQCIQCSGTRHKYTQEEVKTIFAKGGCNLLDIYVSNRKKLNYQCSCGNTAKISLGKFLENQRCVQCGLRKGEKNGNWNPDREMVKLNAIIASRSLAHIKHLLNMQGEKKKLKMATYLGYSVAELRNRITSHPNWPSVKNQKWHIDHIFPVKAFMEHGITDLKIINHLDNLQPLAQKTNLSKSVKYDKAAFKAWLFSKGITI